MYTKNPSYYYRLASIMLDALNKLLASVQNYSGIIGLGLNS